jgi:hypothetical protein
MSIGLRILATRIGEMSRRERPWWQRWWSW